MKKDNQKRLLFIQMIILTLILTYSLSIVKAASIFPILYVVEEGDNLTTIANKFKITVTRLKEANNLGERAILLPGEELYLPIGDVDLQQEIKWPNTELFSNFDPIINLMNWSEYPVRIKKDPIKVSIPKNQQIIYHIKRGDNLYNLAQDFKTSVAVIKSLNKMENSTIRIGQKIILPTSGLTPKQVLSKTIKPYELNLLARVIHGEARGEPYLGKVAVAAVILNRVLSSIYPNTIEGVIYQSSQFESVSNGQFNLHPGTSSYKAAREALKGLDPTLGALYFLNPKVAKNTWWFDRRQKTVTIGNHVFAR